MEPNSRPLPFAGLLSQEHPELGMAHEQMAALRAEYSRWVAGAHRSQKGWTFGHGGWADFFSHRLRRGLAFKIQKRPDVHQLIVLFAGLSPSDARRRAALRLLEPQRGGRGGAGRASRARAPRAQRRRPSRHAAWLLSGARVVER